MGMIPTILIMDMDGFTMNLNMIVADHWSRLQPGGVDKLIGMK